MISAYIRWDCSRLKYSLGAVGLLAMVALAIACGSPAAEPAAVPVSATATPAPAQAAPTAGQPATATAAPAAAGQSATAAPAPTATTEPTATTAPAPTPTVSEPAGFVFTLDDGSVARYKVEEVLARTGFKVATGVTNAVAGAIAVGPDGAVVSEESRIAVQAGALRTDSDRRDGYVRNRTLLTDTYPEVVFVPTAIDGLPGPWDELSGNYEFTITGDLTIRDATRAVTWDAVGDFTAGGNPSGTASVEFTFDDFGMDKPSVAIVLSVEDIIRLELDFSGTLAPR